MLININEIKVIDRIRKDFGNIPELAEDIKENGLINPPVVTPEYELIAGERRLRALKHLNYDQVEVRVMSVKDSEHQLKIEISENENRKEFTFSERVDWAKRLERIEKVKARERMETGGTQNFAEGEKGEAAGITAKESGFGNKETYRQAKYIAENADEEIIKALDEGKLSINRAYKTLKQQKEEIEQSYKILEKSFNDLSSKNNKLERALKNEKSKHSTIIDNMDYCRINELEEEIELLNREKATLEKKAKLNEEEAQKYNELKLQMEFAMVDRQDLHRQIESATSISGLVVEIERFLQTKLAPVKYSRAIREQVDNHIVISNLREIISNVRNWCDEIEHMIFSSTKGNMIFTDVEVI